MFTIRKFFLSPFSWSSSAGLDIFERGVLNIEIDPETQTGTVLLGINNDGLYEADEEFLTVRIMATSTGGIDPARQDAVVTIVDRDGELNIYAVKFWV